MKHLKLFGLVVMASAGLMAVPTGVSATTITSPTGTATTPTFSAVHEGEHVGFHNPSFGFGCNSTLGGKVETHGVGTTVRGNISSLSFSSCTNNVAVDVVTAGALELHHTSGYSGALTSSGMTISVTFITWGFTCRYATNNTAIGTLTGGSSATMHISASLPFHGGSFLCGSAPANWTGSYKVTSPSSFFVDP